MKTRITSMVLLVFLLIPVSVFSSMDNPPEELRERIVTLRNWRLMEVLDLKGARAERVFSILKGFDRRREELIRERRRLIHKLNQLLKEGDTEEINRTLKRLLDTEISIAKLKKEELNALSEVLSPEERARYLLFIERFSRELKRLIGIERRGLKRDRPE